MVKFDNSIEESLQWIVGKTIAKVQYQFDVHDAKRLILHFTDGTKEEVETIYTDEMTE